MVGKPGNNRRRRAQREDERDRTRLPGARPGNANATRDDRSHGAVPPGGTTCNQKVLSSRNQALFLPWVIHSSRIAGTVIAAIENLRPGVGDSHRPHRDGGSPDTDRLLNGASGVARDPTCERAAALRSRKFARSETFASPSRKRDPVRSENPRLFCANDRTSNTPLGDARAVGFERRANFPAREHGGERAIPLASFTQQCGGRCQLGGPHSDATPKCKAL
jgi:hypothetical protein